MEEIEEETPEGSPPQVEPQERLTTGQIVLIILGIILVLVFIFLAFYGLAALLSLAPGQAKFGVSTIRDLSIILLAFVTIVIGAFLIILIFQLQSLISLLREEIKPILESVNETAGTVRGTTTFVSDAVVTPMINVASFASAVGQTLRTLVGSSKGRPGTKPSPTAEPGEPPATGSGRDRG